MTTSPVPDCLVGLDSLPQAARGGVLTIGNFDGVHLGHQKILRRCRQLAREQLPVVAMTFDPPPEVVLKVVPRAQLLSPLAKRCRLLRQAGADWALAVRADMALLSLSPQEFIERVLLERLAPRHVVEGEDFAFGKGRRGCVETLRQAGRQGGFEVHVIEPEMLELPEGPTRISSTLVRQLMLLGRVEQAAQCLGRAPALIGPIISGAGQGRLLEYPTANIEPLEQVWPADGVYAGLADIEGQRFAAAISVGTKPTLGDGGHRFVEAFLIEGEGDFYGRTMELSFCRRLREQRKFADAEALKEQIARDVVAVREIVSRPQ